jgi:shikimate dehydrogenase
LEITRVLFKEEVKFMGLYGLLGESLKHSISPLIHSIIFTELNIEGNYELFEIEKEEVENTINKFKNIGVGGINVTIPYKKVIMKSLDEITSEAKKIGAVNTICFKDKKSIGYNTDYAGFGMMLTKNNIDIKMKKAVVLGSGGAAKAVIQYLIDSEIGEITVVSRGANKIKDIHNNKEYNIISYEEVSRMHDKDLIINCTPCGMYPNVDNCPVEKSDIDKFSTAIDLIYNPKETLFLKYAKQLDMKAVNGLYMLIGQAVCAQELWHDIKISNKIINSVYEKLE